MKQRKNRRPLSAGTVFMLILSVAVIAGSAVVLGRLSSGASVDLSKLKMNLLDLDNGEDLDGDQMPAVTQATAEYPTPQVIQLPAETKASAFPSFTSPIPTTIDESFFFLMALTGASAISITSVQFIISILSLS